MQLAEENLISKTLKKKKKIKFQLYVMKKIKKYFVVYNHLQYQNMDNILFIKEP